MKPVVVFRHAATEGAGYLGKFLDEKSIPWQVVRIDKDDPIPTSALDFSGLVFMGGPMSVNDPLPWIPKLLALIREAVEADIPVLGHCLGGQLMSKALGGVVARNPVKEIGWGQVKITPGPEAAFWFGPRAEFLSFHWHGETFSLPEEAVHLLSSDFCQNQAYAIGKHLAFQCHIEMTEQMINTWCENGADEVRESSASPGVLQVEQIKEQMAARVADLNAIAHGVYTQWITGLAK